MTGGSRERNTNKNMGVCFLRVQEKRLGAVTATLRGFAKQNMS